MPAATNLMLWRRRTAATSYRRHKHTSANSDHRQSIGSYIIGIIQSFKMQYRKLFLRWTVNQLDNRVAKAIDLRDAIEMSEAASEMAK